MTNGDENNTRDRDEHITPQLKLGLKPNINQFLLLILVNAFVGAMIGLEQTVVPLLGKKILASDIYEIDMSSIRWIEDNEYES